MKTCIECIVIEVSGLETEVQSVRNSFPLINQNIRCFSMPFNNSGISNNQGNLVKDNTSADYQAKMPDINFLVQASMELQRFDLILLPVSIQNLSWARTCLQYSKGKLNKPIVILSINLKHQALEDLFELGCHEFINYPASLDEMTIRIRNAQKSARKLMNAMSTNHQDGFYHAIDNATSNNIKQPIAINSNELDAQQYISSGSINELSLKEQKAKLIESFEKNYIINSLQRNNGNITKAALQSKKHRRAFWALIQKYDIDPDLYREY